MKLDYILAAMLLMASVTACTTTPPPHAKAGVEMPPPSGARPFCDRNKTDEHCAP